MGVGMSRPRLLAAIEWIGLGARKNHASDVSFRAAARNLALQGRAFPERRDSSFVGMTRGLRGALGLALGIAMLAASFPAPPVRAELDGDGKDEVAAATLLVVALVMEYRDGLPYQEYARIPLGSAVLVSADGYALTNSHVVDTSFLQSDMETEAASLGIELVVEPDFLIYIVDDRDDAPKARYTAALRDASETLDLAVLQLNGDEDGDPLRGAIGDRPPVALAPPGPVANGDPVHVFGYPVFGDESFSDIGSKSIDVIDSRVRSLEKGPGLRNIVAIHLDAAVSGGSSGGPVVNEAGQLVGVMTEKLDGAGGAGEAVAIPVDRARGVLDEAGWVPPATPEESPTAEPPTPTSEPTPTPTPAPVPPTPSPTATAEPSAAFLPPAFVGSWEGFGTQSNSSEGWSMQVMLEGGPVGEIIGSVEYPSLGCGGWLTLERVAQEAIVVSEALTFGLDVCTDVGIITFSLAADGSLRFDWSSPAADYVSTGFLHPSDGAEAMDAVDGAPISLPAILPTLADVPSGLAVFDDLQRTLDESSLVYSNPADMKQRYQGWGWRANALRTFGVPDGVAAAPESTTFVAVSLHDFGSAEGASQALDYALNDEMSAFGHQEVAAPVIGDRARMIAGRTETGNETLVYTQRGTVLIVVSASSLAGDASLDAITIAESVLRRLDQAQ
jgi:S1-C subfamily serine protease